MESGEEVVVAFQIENDGDTDINMSTVVDISTINEENETLAGRSKKKVVVTAEVASTPLSAMQCEEVLPGITESIKNF